MEETKKLTRSRHQVLQYNLYLPTQQLSILEPGCINADKRPNTLHEKCLQFR